MLSFGDKVGLGSVIDESGSITVIEGRTHAGFTIERVYVLHSLSNGAKRGGHAHRELSQLIVPLNGSFTLKLMNAGLTKVIIADKPDVGIFVPPLTWRDLYDFSPGAVCLVLANAEFDESDYIRSIAEFEDITTRMANSWGKS